MEDLRQPVTVKRRYQSVNMVRHHTPGAQCISLCLKVKERLLDNTGQPWVSQNAGAGGSLGLEIVRNLSRVVNLK